ncbi:hypothetical protein AB205_0033230 [Aquarana catesbeiana]|uniref:Uncharacterized protein n=1 Tax=Aquarana catesbeiana TaxID=8400 RepID=A0A2G9QJC4_AQUCT|nr:hypothetical protein AB205_0033230 [Aquarana catesbeiana]
MLTLGMGSGGKSTFGIPICVHLQNLAFFRGDITPSDEGKIKTVWTY